MNRRHTTVGIAALLSIGLFLGSCGDARPGPGSWEQEWAGATALIPEESTLGEDPAQTCEDVLVALRLEEERLFPTPDELLDDSVRQWFEAAEGTFFECPPVDGGFSPAYETLDELEAAVSASLASLED